MLKIKCPHYIIQILNIKTVINSGGEVLLPDANINFNRKNLKLKKNPLTINLAVSNSFKFKQKDLFRTTIYYLPYFIIPAVPDRVLGSSSRLERYGRKYL